MILVCKSVDLQDGWSSRVIGEKRCAYMTRECVVRACRVKKDLEAGVGEDINIYCLW